MRDIQAFHFKKCILCRAESFEQFGYFLQSIFEADVIFLKPFDKFDIKLDKLQEKP